MALSWGFMFIMLCMISGLESICCIMGERMAARIWSGLGMPGAEAEGKPEANGLAEGAGAGAGAEDGEEEAAAVLGGEFGSERRAVPRTRWIVSPSPNP